MLTEAVRLLSDPRLGKGDAEMVQRVGWRLLPFLVVASTELRLTSSVARSSILTQHPLTLNWAQGDRLTRFDPAHLTKISQIIKHFNE